MTTGNLHTQSQPTEGKVLAALDEFVGKLERGERIMVTTVTKCGCDKGPFSEHRACCHLCGGTGYIEDARTLLPTPDAGE